MTDKYAGLRRLFEKHPEMAGEEFDRLPTGEYKDIQVACAWNGFVMHANLQQSRSSLMHASAGHILPNWEAANHRTACKDHSWQDFYTGPVRTHIICVHCEHRVSVQNTPILIKEVLAVAKAALTYIDALPADISLPAMPGFCRDWAAATIGKANSLIAQANAVNSTSVGQAAPGYLSNFGNKQ